MFWLLIFNLLFLENNSSLIVKAFRINIRVSSKFIIYLDQSTVLSVVKIFPNALFPVTSECSWRSLGAWRTLTSCITCVALGSSWTRFAHGPLRSLGPGGPWLPLSPASPLIPRGPAGPVVPFCPNVPGGPLGPWSPSLPDFPASPLSPRGPVDPCGPGEPAVPAGPAGPGLPGIPGIPGAQKQAP